MSESVLNKSSSESDLCKMSTDTTPPNYLFQRGKRTREPEWAEDLRTHREEMKRLMRDFMSQQETELKKLFAPSLTEIQKSNHSIEMSVTHLINQNEELTNKIQLLEQQNRKDRERITLLEDRLEELQRTSRKTNIEIKNVPKNKSEDKEDLLNMVLCLGKSIDCSMNKSDVRDIYRVREKKDGQKNTPIVVEFSSTIVKTELLKKSKAHNIKNKNKLRAKNLGFTRSEETPVFVSEQLTVKGSRLFFLARDLAKSKGYKFCWTSYGRVYVRMSENTPIILVKSEIQVQNLMQTA